MFACAPASDDAEPTAQDSDRDTQPALAGPRPLFQLPFPCSQQWLAQTYSGHKPNTNSIDLTKAGGGSSGQPIIAASGGLVVRARFESGGGNFVRIDHGNGWQTRYLHMISTPVVREGQQVSQGQLLGHVGSTGDSGAPHLHFEEIQDGTTVRSAFNGQLVTVDVSRPQTLTSFNCGGGGGGGAEDGPGLGIGRDPSEEFDLDGDGRADVCGRGSAGIYCALSSGSDFGPTSLWIAAFSDAGGWSAGPELYSTIRFPDVNGDHRADVCGRGSAGIYCGLGTGSSFGAATLWLPEFSDAGSWSAGPQYYGTIDFPDVNGDGKADVCGRGGPGIYCALSSGSGFAPTTLWRAEFSDAGGWNAGPEYYSTIRFPDVNGDGKADVCGRGGPGVYCALSSGSSFAPAALWLSEFTDAAGWNSGAGYYSTMRFPDINGDGKADICARGASGIRCALSSGTSFAPTALWLSEFTDAGGWNDTPAYYSTIAFADLDGDHRADLCGRGAPGIYCALSSGTRFSSTSLWVASFADTGGWNLGPQYYATIRLTDVNGDGKADVCGRGSPGIYCASSSGSSFGSASVWTSDFSDAGGWAATPAYYGTIRLP